MASKPASGWRLNAKLFFAVNMIRHFGVSKGLSRISQQPLVATHEIHDATSPAAAMLHYLASWVPPHVRPKCDRGRTEKALSVRS